MPTYTQAEVQQVALALTGWTYIGSGNNNWENFSGAMVPRDANHDMRAKSFLVRTGTKEMLITAVAKMTVKSNAFEFIVFHGGGDDLQRLFDAKGDQGRKVPDYYIRGSITQIDDNTVRKSSGAGLPASFFDFGASADVAYDVISMDMSIGDAASRKILPQTSGSNTMVNHENGQIGRGWRKARQDRFFVQSRLQSCRRLAQRRAPCLSWA